MSFQMNKRYCPSRFLTSGSFKPKALPLLILNCLCLVRWQSDSKDALKKSWTDWQFRKKLKANSFLWPCSWEHLVIILLPEQSRCSQEGSGVYPLGAVVFQEAHWPFPFILPLPKNGFQSSGVSAKQYINMQGQHTLYISSINMSFRLQYYHFSMFHCRFEFL